MKKIKYLVKSFSKNNKGYFSILFVILAFIAVLLITGLLDIMKESYNVNEVQGIMDVAGVSALNASINKDALRDEEFKYDESKAQVVFRELIEESMGDSGSIESYKILDLRITDKSVTGFGLGEGNVQANQLILDSTILLEVKTSSFFDLIPYAEKVYYRSYLDDNFTITVNGQTEDGKTELLVRSVSRLVYQ